jgi:hypothetical protein
VAVGSSADASAEAAALVAADVGAGAEDSALLEAELQPLRAIALIATAPIAARFHLLARISILLSDLFGITERRSALCEH